MTLMRAWILSMSLLCGASAVAETSFRFLSMDRGPRSAAMGGAGAARDEGRLEDAVLNPAALGWTGRSEAWSSAGSLMGGARLMQAGYAHPSLEHGAFAFRLLHLGHDPIDAYGTDDSRAGSISPSGTLAALSWGRELRRGFAAGVTLKGFRDDLGAASATGQALDAGILWQASGVPGLTLGAAARNLGPGARYDREKEDLPGLLAAGAAYAAFSDKLRLSLDAERDLQGGDLRMSLGGEVWVRDLLALRAGQHFEKDKDVDVTLGLGLKLSRQLLLDYSFVPMNDFEDAHRVALSYRFGGGKAQALYEDGLRRLAQEDYSEAVLLFDKALTLDPGHTPSARKLKEAAEKLKTSSDDR